MGRFGLRGEAAYTFTSDGNGRDPLVKNPFFFLVMGADRTFLEYLNVNAQYLLRVLAHFRDLEDVRDLLRRTAAVQIAAVTSQRDAVQHGASVRVGYHWWQETLETECAAVLSFTRLDFLLRPTIRYAVSDRWTVSLGGELLRGSRRTVWLCRKIPVNGREETGGMTEVGNQVGNQMNHRIVGGLPYGEDESTEGRESPGVARGVARPARRAEGRGMMEYLSPVVDGTGMAGSGRAGTSCGRGAWRLRSAGRAPGGPHWG